MTDMSSSKNQTDMTFIMKHGVCESCDKQTQKECCGANEKKIINIYKLKRKRSKA